MLVLTLNYFSAHSPCKLMHWSYRENIFFIFSSKTFLEAEKKLMITWRKAGTVGKMLENVLLELFA
jgi:hypothetical protein